jgi:hypothetical protein
MIDCYRGEYIPKLEEKRERERERKRPPHYYQHINSDNPLD